MLPPPPKPDTSSVHPTYYEKYFDPTYQRPYFHNPITGDTVWEVPEGSIVADMTSTVPAEVEAQQPKMTNEEIKKKEAEDKHKEEYKKKQQEIEKLQRENLQAMYPEYY